MKILDFIFSIFKTILQKIFLSFSETINDITQEKGITEKNLVAFLKKKGISDFLKYRDYIEEEKQECGIYIMSDHRKVIILKIIPPAYVGQKIEETLSNFFSSIDDGCMVQMMSFASQNIEKHLKLYEEFHSGNSINVDNPRTLQDMVSKRVMEIRKWTKTSMAKGVDFRIKDFQNLLVVNFPEDTENKSIYKFYDEIKGSLGDFHPENYNADSLLTLLSEMFYFDKEPSFWESIYDSKMQLNHQIVSGGLKVSTDKSFQGFTINGKTKYKVLTTKSFPNDLSLFEYNNLFFDKMGNTTKIPIPTSFFISLSLIYDDVDKRKEAILGKLNHDIGELSKLRPIDLKKRPDLRMRMKETEESIALLREYNEIPIKGMWTLTIMDEDEKKLNEYVSAIKKKFSDVDWKIVEESSNNIALLSFLYSLPGQLSRGVEETSKRFRVLFKSNHASMAPIIGDNIGVGDYNLLTFGRTGQIQRFDPFAKGAAENPNIVKFGGSGSGKSFSETEFHWSSLTAGYLMRVIDAGGSYETFCKSVGGQYIEFAEDVELSLNFFTKARVMIDQKGDTVLHPEEIASITSIIGLMGGINLTHEFKSGSDVTNITKVGIFTESIIMAINIAFARSGFSAKLEDVRDIIIEIADEHHSNGRSISDDLKNFASSLYRFADKRGPFYSYFNPPNNVDFSKDYVVIETQSLLNISKDLFVVIVSILTNQIKNEFFSKKLLSKRKILTVDEAKPILDNDISLDLLIQIYRKIRKYNGLANTITQSINDFFENDKVKVLYEIAGWRWLLRQKDGVIDTAYNSGRLSIGRFEKRIMESIKNNAPSYGEYYISSDFISMISRLKIDNLSYWLYTTDPTDKSRVSVLMNERHISELDARLALSLVFDGETLDTAINLAKKRQFFHMDHAKLIHLCNKVVDRVIEKDSLIEIHGMDIVDKNDFNQKYFLELFSEILNDDGISASMVFKHKKEIINMDKFEEVILNKLLQHISKRKGVYSINLSVESLTNRNIFDTIKEFSLNHPTLTERIIFEIPLANLDYEENDFVNNVIKDIQELGFKIINDNLKNGERITNILKYNLDYIKISPEVYANEEENHISEITMGAIKAIYENYSIKVIATMIESEKDMEMVKNMEYVDLVQGYYISKRKKEL